MGSSQFKKSLFIFYPSSSLDIIRYTIPEIIQKYYCMNNNERNTTLDFDFISVFDFVWLMELFRFILFVHHFFFFFSLFAAHIHFVCFHFWAWLNQPQTFGRTKEKNNLFSDLCLVAPCATFQIYVNSLSSNFYPKWNVFIAFQRQITIWWWRLLILPFEMVKWYLAIETIPFHGYASGRQ